MNVSVLHASAGYGHQKVAEVIYEGLLSSGQANDRFYCEDSLDFTPSFFKKSYPAIYYYSVKWSPQSWGWSYELLDQPVPYAFLKPFRMLGNSLVGKELLNKALSRSLDALIFTHFFSAELFARAKKKGKLKAKLITIVTDFYPHTFWVNEGTDIYWVMCQETADDLVGRGVSANRIVVGGIPVSPAFVESSEKTPMRSSYGFEENRLTLLMTGGSFGLGPQLEILRELNDQLSNEIQCFVVCGNNQKMLEAVQSLEVQFPLKAFGFIDHMAELMKMSDLLLAKPGGSTTSESLAVGIPMIVMSPIPGQETRNASLLRKREAAFFMEKPSELVTILKSILNDRDLLKNKHENILQLAKAHATNNLVDFVKQNVA